MFSQLDSPPFERGMTWSTVKFEREPQYWQVQLSRANTARRVILRRCASRGTLTYVIRRMTTGRASVKSQSLLWASSYLHPAFDGA